jgi:hypothetical protein
VCPAYYRQRDGIVKSVPGLIQPEQCVILRLALEKAWVPDPRHT